MFDGDVRGGSVKVEFKLMKGYGDRVTSRSYQIVTVYLTALRSILHSVILQPSNQSTESIGISKGACELVRLASTMVNKPRCGNSGKLIVHQMSAPTPMPTQPNITSEHQLPSQSSHPVPLCTSVAVTGWLESMCQH